MTLSSDIPKGALEGQVCSPKLDNSTLSMYLKDIKSLGGELLAINEEQQLGKRKDKGDKKAFNTLVERNLRLAISIASKYKRWYKSSPPLEDLIQYGNEGLLKAAEKYDWQRNLKFSTYATWWIRQSVMRGIIDSGQTIRVPVHVFEKEASLRKFIKSFIQKNGHFPEDENILEHFDNWTQSQLDYLRSLPTCFSLDDALQSNNGNEVDYWLFYSEDKSIVSVQELIETIDKKNDIEKALSSLNWRTERIIRIYHELNPDDNEYYGRRGNPTLDDIGKRFSITRERVRQIESTGLKILKKKLEDLV